MVKSVGVTNPLGDYEENLVRVAQAIGKADGVKWRVFDVVYGRGKKPMTAAEIAKKTGDRVQSVRNASNRMAHDGLLAKSELPGSIRYGKQPYIAGMKERVRSLVANPSKIASIRTKRSRLGGKVSVEFVSVNYPSAMVSIELVAVDNIDSFSAVCSVKSDAAQLEGVSEDQFKAGIQKIIGERARFKDWGGETSDLMTTRVVLNGRRIGAAFAFKGPGKKGKLVPGSMGKNGDQAQRLFTESAELFVVQHWREIDPSVLRLMEQLAIAKSVSTGRKIYYCVIDGADSARLVSAYAAQFR